MRVAERIARQRVSPGAVAIWWLGQNSYVVKGAGAVLMIDPFFSRPGPAEKYLHDEAPLRAEELAPDAVLCTHAHSDHTDPAFLCALAGRSPDTHFFGPPESAMQIVDSGVPANRVSALEPAATVSVGSAQVAVVLSKTPQVSDLHHYGYIISLGGGPKVYDTGDIMRGVTGEPALMEPLRRAAPEVALITMSPTEEEFPDFAEGAELAREVGVRVAMPAHYGCFAARSFDPAGFAAQFREGEISRPVIVPYCGVHVYRPRAE